MVFRRARKRINTLLWRGISYFLHRVHSPICVPTTLGLCMTHKCNLKCVYCMRHSFLPPKGELTLSQVKYLIKKMPYVSTITIQGLCEPYLNAETPAIIEWLKSQGFHISFTTNGTVTLEGERLECLRCVDDFVISVDTGNAETFGYLRSGTSLKVVMENLKRVVEWKRSLGLSVHDNPPMHINAVITKANISEMKGLIRMLEPYRDQITYVMVDPVSRPDYSKVMPLALERDARFKEWLEDFRAFVAKESKLHVVGLDYMLVPSTNWRDCALATMNLWIEPNGDIYNFYGFRDVLGNAFRDNPLFAFNCRFQRAFRRRLRSANPPLQQCRTCNFAREGWQIHGGYITQSRVLSVKPRMTFYEALKHVLTVLTRKGDYTF